MTLGTLLMSMGIAKDVIGLIGDIIDLDQKVTPEAIADAEARVADKRDEWDSLA